MEISSSLSIGPRRPVPTLVALLAPLILVALAALTFEVANSGRIYPGVRIAGVDVGWAQTTDAVSLLTTKQRQLAASRLIAHVGGRRWILRAADIGARYDLTAQVSAAYRLGRQGTVLTRLKMQALLLARPTDLAPLVYYDRRRLDVVVTALARQIDRPAVDAAVVLRRGVVTLLHPAASGSRLDQQGAAARLAVALTRPHGQVVTLSIAVLAPRVTTDLALARALQSTLALGKAQRVRAGLAAYAHVMTRRNVLLVAHGVARETHLEALARTRRAQVARLTADLAAHAARLPALSVGGALYTVPAAMAQAMLRIQDAPIGPRTAVNPSGVRRTVATLSVRVDRQPHAARLLLRHGKLLLVPSSQGLALDQPAAERVLATVLVGSHEGALSLPVRALQPSVTTADLQPALLRGQWLLAHPPTLVSGKVRWTPAPGALAPALQVGSGQIGLGIAPRALKHVVAWLAGAVGRTARDATFDADGRKAWVVPSVDGVALDQAALGRLLLTVRPGTRAVSVPLRPVLPRLTTARARAMHIGPLVGMGATNFDGSPGNRITNILVSMRALDGVLIAPGDVFSFNKSVGDIDYAHGYVDGITILDGKDVPGVGGGVCQVAVTIFKGAIYTGLLIVERVPHANVVSYYQPTGMDATIYNAPGGPDVKFKNDTGHWLLMKFAYNLDTAYLEVRFYGTDIKQRTEISGPYYSYVANGDTTAIFYRKVYRHGKKIRDENFWSEYVPAQ